MDKSKISVIGYDKYQLGGDNSILLPNNSFINDTVANRYLTIDEIKELELFVNPIDGNVFSIQNNSLKRNERFTFESY